MRTARPLINWWSTALAGAFYGRPKTEFTYDVADPAALPAALRTIGRAMRLVLGPIEKHLLENARAPLARRYSAVWHQDILVAVKKNPKPLVGLLAAESRLITAVIDLREQCRMPTGSCSLQTRR